MDDFCWGLGSPDKRRQNRAGRKSAPAEKGKLNYREEKKLVVGKVGNLRSRRLAPFVRLAAAYKILYGRSSGHVLPQLTNVGGSTQPPCKEKNQSKRVEPPY